MAFIFLKFVKTNFVTQNTLLEDMCVRKKNVYSSAVDGMFCMLGTFDRKYCLSSLFPS